MLIFGLLISELSLILLLISSSFTSSSFLEAVSSPSISPKFTSFALFDFNISFSSSLSSFFIFSSTPFSSLFISSFICSLL
jgi:hypothetical protein